MVEGAVVEVDAGKVGEKAVAKAREKAEVLVLLRKAKVKGKARAKERPKVKTARQREKAKEKARAKVKSHLKVRAKARARGKILRKVKEKARARVRMRPKVEVRAGVKGARVQAPHIPRAVVDTTPAMALAMVAEAKAKDPAGVVEDTALTILHHLGAAVKAKEKAKAVTLGVIKVGECFPVLRILIGKSAH